MNEPWAAEIFSANSIRKFRGFPQMERAKLDFK
jgi:hypothetical protein